MLAGPTVIPQEDELAGTLPPDLVDDRAPDGDTTILARPDTTVRMSDVRRSELVAIAPLLVLAVVLGLFPRLLLDVIEPAAVVVTQLVAR